MGMVTTELITVLTTVYNGEKYIRETINSVLKQTYPLFEYIIVDDGSQDSTTNIIKEFHSPKIRLICNEKNMGIVYSANRGLKGAKGKYIARLDADDICLPDRLETQLKFLETHQDFMMCGTLRKILYEDNGKIVKEATGMYDYERIKFELLFNNCFVHSSIMFRNLPGNDCKWIYHNYSHTHDYELVMRIALEHKVGIINKELIIYRVHCDSHSNLVKNKNEEVLELRNWYLNQLDLSDPDKKIIWKFINLAVYKKEEILDLIKVFESYYEKNRKSYYLHLYMEQQILNYFSRYANFGITNLFSYFRSSFFSWRTFLTKKGAKLVIKCIIQSYRRRNG